MSRQHGFTLVEMIIAMVITGILSGMVAIFIAGPVTGYVDTARRAQLTDMADLALKRIALELRTAVPNSVRPTGALATSVSDYIEFIPSIGGGRYCSDQAPDVCPTGKPMTNVGSGATAAGSFDVLGPLPSGITANSDRMIIYNTQQTGLDAYANNNCARLTNSTSPLSYDSASPFPFASPSNRFMIAKASGPVKFSCASGNSITRIQGSSPFCGLTFTPSSALLISADSVECKFRYTPKSVSNGLVTLELKITSSGETVTLSSQVHVDNLP